MPEVTTDLLLVVTVPIIAPLSEKGSWMPIFQSEPSTFLPWVKTFPPRLIIALLTPSLVNKFDITSAV